MEGALRVDVLLHRLCLTRSRNEAKVACDSGAVRVEGKPVRASYEVTPGQRLEIRFPRRTLHLQVDELPPKSTSRKAAREMYHVLAESDPE